jgi:DNA-binding CsgD family transcriptional regulator
MQLAAQLVRAAHRPGGAGDGSLLLDITVDGCRCVVARAPTDATIGRLSPREVEIARMVAAGHANKTIAAALDISTWTVGSHLRRIFTKLSVTSRAAMVTRLAQVDTLEALLAPIPQAACTGPPVQRGRGRTML